MYLTLLYYCLLLNLFLICLYLCLFNPIWGCYVPGGAHTQWRYSIMVCMYNSTVLFYACITEILQLLKSLCYCKVWCIFKGLVRFYQA